MRPGLRSRQRARHEDRAGAFQLVRLRRHQRNARVPPLPLILVDGQAADAIPATDRGLAFGDGVFRTLAVRAGRPLNWSWHWRRLAADCRLLALTAPDEAVLLAELRRVAPGDAVAKIIVTRGPATRGYAPRAGSRGTRVVAAFAAPDYPPQHARDGIRARRCALTLSEQPRLAGAKTLNRLENVLARAEWDDAAISEGLLGDAGGHVVEGTMSNLFIVHGGVVATPALARCGVIGAQRERARELLGGAGYECVERDIRWAELEVADEAFLTNSLIGIWPIAALGDRRWGAWPIARQLQQLVARDDARA
ncbi:MAG TPA: aminodeoxychorismate lyase [Usitatibacter sp.]|nr:aminodeoxychorismate lyase [Usitatibacter sp.]